jgi:hypothetical protein
MHWLRHTLSTDRASPLIKAFIPGVNGRIAKLIKIDRNNNASINGFIQLNAVLSRKTLAF